MKCRLFCCQKLRKAIKCTAPTFYFKMMKKELSKTWLYGLSSLCLSQWEDLYQKKSMNTKKSWHPNTIKNQERVWKAEQAVAEEKRRIQDLQRERAEERDREELNSLAKRCGNTSDNRLHWMYDKPDKKVQEEDYLLGKSIEKNYDQPNKTDQDVIPAVARRVVGSSMLSAGGDSQVDLARKIREDPLLLVKERERAARAALLNNPLQRRRLTELLRKEQEQRKESKEKKKPKKKDKDLDNLLAAKLNALVGEKSINLATLLGSDNSSSDLSSDEGKTKKKKDIRKSKKSKTKKKKYKHSSDDTVSEDEKKYKTKSNEKINKIKDASKRHKESRKRKSDSSEDEVEIKKYKKSSSENTKKNNRDSGRFDSIEDKKNRKSKSKGKLNKVVDVSMRHNDSRKRKEGSDSSDDEDQVKKHLRSNSENIEKRNRGRNSDRRDLNEEEYRSDAKANKSSRRDSSEEHYRRDSRRRISPDKSSRRDLSDEHYKKDIKRLLDKKRDFDGIRRKQEVSEEEKAARLAAMAAAGAEREVQRGRRVAEQRAAAAAAEAPSRRPRVANEARNLPDSLERRIHSNRHYIQRDQRHMDENFARR